MSDPHSLGLKWQSVLDSLSRLGPMRPGSICQMRLRRSGARGPYTILTSKEKGKTRTRMLPGGEKRDLLKRQIENFRLFRKAVGELVAIGKRRADLEVGALAEGKKNSSRRSGPNRKSKSLGPLNE